MYIVLDERKRRQEEFSVLVSMSRTKVSALDGLKSGVLPVAPLTRTFAVLREWETDSLHHLSCSGSESESDDRILRG